MILLCHMISQDHLNILCFINCVNSSCYCFSDKYDAADLHYNCDRQISMPQIEFANFGELLDKNQLNESFQKLFEFAATVLN